jgi:dipeptidyl aminopeptidase/acylaminoacyl peptidase
MRSIPLVLRLALAVGAALALPLQAQPLTLDRIMDHPDWIGPPVEQAWWALDGSAAHYVLKRKGSSLRDTYRLDLASGEPARVEGEALAGLDAAGPVFDASRQRAAFLRNGELFVRNLPDGALRQLTRGGGNVADPRFTPDGRGIVYRSGPDWYRVDLASGLSAAVVLPRAAKDPDAAPEPDLLREHQLRLITTLARERADREALRAQDRERRAADPSRAPAPVYLGDQVELRGSALSPDARWLLLVTEAKGGNGGQVGKMPKYVTESGYEEMEDVRTRVGRNPPLGHALHLIDTASGERVELSFDNLPGIKADPLAALRKAAGRPALEGARPARVMGMDWSADGTQAAVMLRANDNKDRWIATVDFGRKALQPQHRLTDPAWINWSFNEFGWLRDGRFWFLSEESGHAHFYTQVPGSKPVQHTRGPWEVSEPAVAPDGRHVYFVCNMDWPGDYELCRLDLVGGSVVELTDIDGVEDFVLSPDASQVLLRWSAHHTPPQLAVMPAGGGELRRLTDTRSEAYRAQDWLAPQFVQVPSSHFAGSIPGKFYRPAELEPGKRYPIALFVHGAGYLQNVWARWPVYFREQMFHQLLVEHGYLVLDLDFRASAGYGRDWRTAIYQRMGHPELEDYLDGIAWLVEQQQGDAERVGIYGGSYGGFMSFMALFREPERFVAGAALRPVTDWTSYNHEYTSNILNTPDIDPEAYRRSSPIEYVENFRGHLLISHGMIDDNVFYQDSVRLAQRLIELKKHNWELASYPMERHGYVHPESWYDQYRRIFELFERTLK